MVCARHGGRPGAAGSGGLPGPRGPCRHVLVPVSLPGPARPGRPAAGEQPGGALMTLIAPTTEAFFTDRLAAQRKASPHTITAYRDSLKLLLAFASPPAGNPASRPAFAALDATP